MTDCGQPGVAIHVEEASAKKYTAEIVDILQLRKLFQNTKNRQLKGSSTKRITLLQNTYFV